MLDRFTTDLWKIAQDGGLTMNAMAGNQRAFMLGGNGNDILTGGSLSG